MPFTLLTSGPWGHPESVRLGEARLIPITLAVHRNLHKVGYLHGRTVQLND